MTVSWAEWQSGRDKKNLTDLLSLTVCHAEPHPEEGSNMQKPIGSRLQRIAIPALKAGLLLSVPALALCFLGSPANGGSGTCQLSSQDCDFSQCTTLQQCEQKFCQSLQDCASQCGSCTSSSFEQCCLKLETCFEQCVENQIGPCDQTALTSCVSQFQSQCQSYEKCFEQSCSSGCSQSCDQQFCSELQQCCNQFQQNCEQCHQKSSGCGCGSY
jgi:hypothetical protein